MRYLESLAFISALLLASMCPSFATNICGDVTGIWDTVGSPYYVTCDVNVPAGQTLDIHPGVQILFTGHYKFNVYGNLQAVGNEQDSVVFKRAFLTDESRWWGVRFQGPSANGHLAYCVIANGHASGGDNDNSAGGVLISQCSPLIEHSSIRNNLADSDGGGIVCIDHASPTIRDCDIVGNSAAFGGGIICRLYSTPVFQRCCILNNSATNGYGGGVHDYLYAAPMFDHCLFAGNSSVWCGAGVQFEEGCGGTFINCTFTQNSTQAEGGAICLTGNSVAELQNCVLWNNQANTSPEIHLWNSTISVVWSDIAGGIQGLGNIDADPLFVDPANGDFHLQTGSPCINTGDPSSPHDSDSSRADMGAFPFTDEVLPVELTSFDALPTDDGIRLTFSLASERNNDHFEILRGQLREEQFSLLTSIPSQGNSSVEQHYEYVDRNVTSGQTYWYYLVDVDAQGNRTEHRNLVRYATAASGSMLPVDFSLSAYPNPFNPQTKIAFSLPEAQQVRLSVFDVTGRMVKELAGASFKAGQHQMIFDAADLPTGVYIARIECAKFVKSEKLLLLK